METILLIAFGISAALAAIFYLGALFDAKQPIQATMITSMMFTSSKYESEYFNERQRRALSRCRLMTRVACLFLIAFYVYKFAPL